MKILRWVLLPVLFFHFFFFFFTVHTSTLYSIHTNWICGLECALDDECGKKNELKEKSIFSKFWVLLQENNTGSTCMCM